MPIKKSAKKALRQSSKRRQRNLQILSNLKYLIKKTKKSIIIENLTQAEELLQKTIKALDKAAPQNIIKKNTANRYKSRLAKMLNLLKSKLKK
jgi:small subunit ribosomal protein S20